jgi:hypothetical protein
MVVTWSCEEAGEHHGKDEQGHQQHEQLLHLLFADGGL